MVLDIIENDDEAYRIGQQIGRNKIDLERGQNDSVREELLRKENRELQERLDDYFTPNELASGSLLK